MKLDLSKQPTTFIGDDYDEIYTSRAVPKWTFAEKLINGKDVRIKVWGCNSDVGYFHITDTAENNITHFTAKENLRALIQEIDYPKSSSVK